MITDRDLPGSLAYAVHRLTGAAQAVREQLSTDTWLVLGRLETVLAEVTPAGDVPARASHRCWKASSRWRASPPRATSATPAGTSPTRADGVERAQHVAALVAATLCAPGLPAADGLVQESVLIAAESLITARRRPRTGLDALLELLITDPDNPRSIGYQADRLRQDVAHVPGPDDGVLGALVAVEQRLAGLRPADLARLGPDGTRDRLHSSLLGLGRDLTRFADVLEGARFAPGAPLRPLGPVAVGGGRVNRTYRISHRTTYGYDDDVGDSFGRAHLLPRDRPGQTASTRRSPSRRGPQSCASTPTCSATAPPTSPSPAPTASSTVLAESTVAVDERPAPASTPPWEAVRDRLRGATDPLLVDARVLRAAVAAAAGARRGRRLRAGVVPAGPPSRRRPRSTSAARIHARLPLRHRRDDGRQHRRPSCWPAARASARTSRTSPSAACARWGWPRATSAATWRPRRRRAAAAGRRGRLARVGLGAGPGRRLARRRPDQRPARRRSLRRRWRYGRDYGDVPPLKGVIFTEARREHVMDVAVDMIRVDRRVEGGALLLLPRLRPPGLLRELAVPALRHPVGLLPRGATSRPRRRAIGATSSCALRQRGSPMQLARRRAGRSSARSCALTRTRPADADTAGAGGVRRRRGGQAAAAVLQLD